MSMNRGWGSRKKPTKQQRQRINRNRTKTDQGRGAKSDPNKVRKPKPIKDPRTSSGFGFGGSFGQGGFGGGNGPGKKPQDRPEPSTPAPEGYEWVFDEGLDTWVLMPSDEVPEEEEEEEEEEEPFNNDLMAYVTDLLSQYGLDSPGLLDFTRNAISQGWSSSQIMLELRKHPDYLANPLFAANAERAKKGGGWMAEGKLIAYKNETKRLARQYGYAEPSDTYIAENIKSGRSLAEFEHRVQTMRQVEDYGPAVRMVFENELGMVMGDKDLYELFDPETDTQEWTQAYKNALYRGRPAVLGLGIRSEREAAALQLLGVNPDEAFSRYQGVAQNASRFDRLGTIEQGILDKLPDNFGNLSAADNSLLVRGLVFQDPRALAELQALTSREIARFTVGGGAASSQGQSVGLLSSAEKATYG